MNTYRLLKNFEYFFVVLTILCVGYIGYFFLILNKSVGSQVVFPSIKSSEVETEEDLASGELKPYDFYAQQIDSRDVFVALKQVKAVEHGGALGQLPANFKVVGIILGDSAQVIIEDQTVHRTYFIAQNAPENGISIKRVLKDKIVLGYQNQNIEINVKGN